MAVGQGEFTHQKRPRSRGTVVLLVLVAVGLTSGSRGITGPKEMRGELGQSVTVVCPYDREYSDYRKRWSKGDYYLSSSTVVTTDHPRQARTSINDNKTQLIVSVTIDNLVKSDEGRYWCVIVKGILSINEKTSISLKVYEGTRTSRPGIVNTTSTIITTRTSTTTTLTTLPQDAPTTKEASSTESHGSILPSREAGTFPQHVVLSIALTIVFLLFITAIILCVKMRQKKKTGSNGNRIISQENPAGSFKETPVIYTTVTTRSPASMENTYMNLQDMNTQGQAKRQGAAEIVYATILTDNN